MSQLVIGPVNQPNGSTGGASGPLESEALEMIEVFSSVGADCFTLTVTDINKRGLGDWKNCPAQRTRELIGPILYTSAGTLRPFNVILRPYPTHTPLVQLDDLDRESLDRLRPFSFLSLCTSPGSYQVWLAVRRGDKEFERRLRKGTGADMGASGSVRVSGSLNVKPEYGPVYPRVQTIHLSPARIVKRSDLEGLATHRQARGSPRGLPPCAPIQSGKLRILPDYQKCLQRKRKANGKPDRSTADFFWAWQAVQRGFSVEEITQRLMGLSGKAQERDYQYAVQTAEKAAESVGRLREVVAV